MASLFKSARSGVFWMFFRGLGSQGFQIVTSIIIARLLFPEDFGMMAKAMIAIQFARRLGQFGFSTILVQRKELSDDHIKTAFTLNLSINSLIFAILFFSAGPIATFLESEGVKPLLQVLSAIFVISGFYYTPIALLKRNLRFKDTSMIAFMENVINFTTPVIFAWLGFGVWSLVIGAMLGHLSNLVMSHWLARWWPKFGINVQCMKETFSFGVWLNVQSYIAYFSKNIDYVIVGKFLGDAALGFYERAYKLMHIPRRNFTNMLQTVLLSAYSRMQDDEKRLYSAIDRVVFTASLFAYPVMISLWVLAPYFVIALYTEKWAAMITPFQILCLAGIFETLASLFDPVLVARGAVKQGAMLLFWKLLFLVIAVFVGINWGVNGVAWAVTVNSLFYLCIFLYFLRTRMNYSLVSFLKNQRTAVLYTLTMIALVIGVEYLMLPAFGGYPAVMLIGLLLTTSFGLIAAHLLWRSVAVINAFNDLFGDYVKKYERFSLVRHTVRLLKLEPVKQ